MKKIAVIAILIALVTGSVFAQQGLDLDLLQVPGFLSPQGESTQGLILSDADNFMRPDAFSDVNFNKWFGMTSFADEKLTIGYATKLGGGGEGEEAKTPIYVGLLYRGSFWAKATSHPYEESRVGSWNGDPKNDVRQYAVLPSVGNDLNAIPYNQVALLIGLENMGFRISFIGNHESFKGNEFMAGGTEVYSHETDWFDLSPNCMVINKTA